jgi:hypothetical protein
MSGIEIRFQPLFKENTTEPVFTSFEKSLSRPEVSTAVTAKKYI